MMKTFPFLKTLCVLIVMDMEQKYLEVKPIEYLVMNALGISYTYIAGWEKHLSLFIHYCQPDAGDAC